MLQQDRERREQSRGPLRGGGVGDGGSPRRERGRNGPEHDEIVQEVLARLEKGEGGLAAVPADDLVEAAEKLGQHLAQNVKLKPTQIRRVLTQINRLNAEMYSKERFERSRVVLLKPRLAYAAGQHDEVKPLAKVLVQLIDRVHEFEDYKRFARFVEAVVAYHRYHGGPRE